MSNFNFPGWDNINKEEQAIIFEMLKIQEFISDGDVIVNTTVTTQTANPLCQIACRAAQAVAITACAGNPVCIAIAYEAGEECMRRC
ncbi:MAG: hypothetical protein ACKE8G_07725 [Methylophagaceae bacterium]